jgi:hypothetical protein
MRKMFKYDNLGQAQLFLLALVLLNENLFLFLSVLVEE